MAARELEAQLDPHLGTTIPNMSISKAVARRLRRIYLYLFAVQLLAWLFKLSSTPGPAKSLAEFIHRGDFKVPLTEAPSEHYSQGRGHLEVAELSWYMESLGHGVPTKELQEMMHEVGIDENKDGCIIEDEFLEFIRCELVAELPWTAAPALPQALPPGGR